MEEEKKDNQETSFTRPTSKELEDFRKKNQKTPENTWKPQPNNHQPMFERRPRREYNFTQKELETIKIAFIDLRKNN